MRLPIEEQKQIEPKLQLDAQAIAFFSEHEEKEEAFEVEKTNFENLIRADEQCVEEKPEKDSESSSQTSPILKRIGETLLPLLDDVVGAIVTLLKKVLSKELFASISYFAVSIIGAVLHLKEIYAEYKKVIEAYNDPQTPQRNMRIALGIWNMFLGISGAIISLGLLGCGIAVAVGVALPTFILSVFNPISMGLLTAICINRFLVSSDALDHAKKAEEIAKTTYLNDSHFNDTFFELLEQSNQLEKVSREINEFRTKEHDKLSRLLLYKINNHKKLTNDEKNEYQDYLDRIENKTKEIIYRKTWYTSTTAFNERIIDVNNKIKTHGTYSFQKKRQAYHTCQNDRINAEKKVKYSFIEVVGSIIVFLGIVSGLLPVILFGAAVGISGKITEELNTPDPDKFNKQFNHILSEDKPFISTTADLARPLSQPSLSPSTQVSNQLEPAHSPIPEKTSVNFNLFSKPKEQSKKQNKESVAFTFVR